MVMVSGVMVKSTSVPVMMFITCTRRSESMPRYIGSLSGDSEGQAIFPDVATVFSSEMAAHSIPVLVAFRAGLEVVALIISRNSFRSPLLSVYLCDCVILRVTPWLFLCHKVIIE